MPEIPQSKSLDDYFSDWEGHVFGFGYGTGEKHILPVLRQFLNLCNKDHNGYDFEILEAKLSPVVAWLFINVLCRTDIIEYGTSPRYGWLTSKGIRLRNFILSKTDHELYMLGCRDSDYTRCYPDVCNCGPDGYDPDRICQNPFWRD